MTASLALRIDGAEKRFDETLALDGASLTLERGEWLALLGPNVVFLSLARRLARRWERA